MYSFSQNFEDVYIRRAFSDVKDGFYIDAGAYDPLVDSVTKMLYDIGWKGINLEPGPSFPNFQLRTRDINLAVALAPESGKRRFEYNTADPGTSRLLGGESAGEANAHVMQYDVPTLSLQELIHTYAPNQHIHFLKLDIEGGEWDVLRTTDWSTIRPELLVVECTLPYTNERRDAGWADHMARFDYTEVFFDGINTYYLRNESGFRRSAFDRPVNVLDGVRKFDPVQHGAAAAEAGKVIAAAEVESLREQLGMARASAADQEKAQEEQLALLRSIATSLFVSEEPGAVVAPTNSPDSLIPALARRIIAWKDDTDREVEELKAERDGALERARLLEDRVAATNQHAAEASILKERLTETRRSRSRVIDLATEMAARERQKLRAALAEQESRAFAAVQRSEALERALEESENGRRQEAARYQAFLESEIEAFKSQGKAEFHRGSKAKIRRILALDLRNRAILKRADRLRDTGEFAAAAAAYAVAFRRFPERVDLCVQRANALKDCGAFAAAEHAYREAAGHLPEDPDIFLQLGHLYAMSGRIERSKAAYRHSVYLSSPESDAGRALQCLENEDGLN